MWGKMMQGAGKAWGATKGFAGKAWGSSIGRGALIGAGIGGYQGSDNGFGGFMGGAIGGAAAGAAMGKWGGAAMGKLRTGASLGAAKGIGAIGNSKFLTNQGFGGKLGVGMAGALDRGAGLMSNKYAGKTLFAAGAASAGLIGTSMLGSNRGY